MKQNTKFRIFILSVFMIALLAIVLSACNQSQTPIGKACTQEAKLCPDGSYAGRTGPNCEFALCPDENPNNGQITNGYLDPEDSSEIGLSSYPDLPLNSIPSTPIGIGYLIEHRSALNEKAVTVNGIIIASWLDESKCPQNVGLLCPQPRIFLADTDNQDRNPHYDLDVKVGEEDAISELKKDYPVGKIITIKVLVYGDKTGVSAIKVN